MQPGESLESLFISSRYSCHTFVMAGINALTNLHSFKLFLALTKCVSTASAVSFLHKLLSSSQFTALRTLDIVISSFNCQNLSVSNPGRRKAWKALDITLSLPRYATLEHDLVHFFVENSTMKIRYPVQGDVVKAMLSKLPKRQNTDFSSLSFSASVYPFP